MSLSVRLLHVLKYVRVTVAVKVGASAEVASAMAIIDSQDQSRMCFVERILWQFVFQSVLSVLEAYVCAYDTEGTGGDDILHLFSRLPTV